MRISVYVCLIEATFLFCVGYNVQEVLPFLVKIEAKNKILDCAGTIISSCIALTSAHCIEGVQPFDVTVSHIAKSIHKYEIASIIIHPEYKTKTLGNDIGLLKIVKNFEEPWIPVTLNNADKFSVFPECSFFQIVGWSGQITRESVENEGKPAVALNFTEKPMTATVKLISNTVCSDLIKNFGGKLEGDEKLCGVTKDDETEEGGHGGCFAGPGGPLLCSLAPQGSNGNFPVVKDPEIFKSKSCNESETLDDPIDLLVSFKKDGKIKRAAENKMENLQVGVISWGKSCSKVPSVYVRTDLYYGWIKDSIREMMRKDTTRLNDNVLTPPSQNAGPSLTNFNFNAALVCFRIIISLALL